MSDSPPAFRLRRAVRKDLPAVLELEAESFPPERRESPRSLKRSLSSPSQEVWLLCEGKACAGCIVLRLHPRAIRAYSLAVRRQYRGQGVGGRLLTHAFRRARVLGKSRLTLESDAQNPELLRWYASRGFKNLCRLPDYYGPGRDAWRMIYLFKEEKEKPSHGRP